MKKLHELLAVKSNLENQARKCLEDLKTAFDKKRHLFEEKRVQFTPVTEGSQSVTESQSDLQTTVRKELDLIKPVLAGALDVALQINRANMVADSYIEVDGFTLASSVPATELLELEKRIAEIRSVVDAMPTLDPAKAFRPDTTRNQVYVAREVTKKRTKKTIKYHVPVAATKEHPAQVFQVPEDEVVGTIVEMEWSGMVTPAEKSDMLARCDNALRGVQAARSRANSIEVDTDTKIGDSLLKYIFNGTV